MIHFTDTRRPQGRTYNEGGLLGFRGQTNQYPVRQVK